MELVFRDLRSHVPAPGDIVLRPVDAQQQDRRDLAACVLGKGTEALVRGPGEALRLVVAANPTLDDMLAAAFAERLLAGGGLPAAAQGLARYAALQREGLHPGEVPLAESIEGVFLAQRNAHGEHLEDALVGGKFATDWRRTAQVLLAAAERGADAFKSALFGGPEFARERAFLAKDREVYRQDVLRGERWIVRLPGGPPRASALILREPRALLAKQWARGDAEAPIGGAYLLLGVRWGPGQWVFSTDPVQRLPIRPLAEALQTAEAKADRVRAEADPWFDGKPFGHTLVGAPRGGTRLPDDTVLRVVRAWTKARRAPTRGRRRLMFGLAALGGAGLAAGLLLAFLPREEPGRAPVDFRIRGARLTDAQKDALKAGTPRMRGFALLISVGKGQGKKPVDLPGAAADVGRLYRLLHERFGYAPEDMLVLSDEPEKLRDGAGEPIPVAPGLPDRKNVAVAIDILSERAMKVGEGEHAQLVFYYAGHGTSPRAGERSGYLVLSGFADSTDPLSLRGYDMADLAGHLRRTIAGCSQQLVLMDCCHSGLSRRTKGDWKKEPSDIFELWDHAALPMITAGTDEQKIDDAGQSVFNSILLEALGGDDGDVLAADGFLAGQEVPPHEAKDGIVTDAELGVYLEERIPDFCEVNACRPQTPLYVRGLEGDDVGQFLFVPRAAAGR